MAQSSTPGPDPIGRPQGRLSVGRGIAWMLAAAFVYAVMDALIKRLTVGYPILQIVFFRNLFAILVLAPLILRRGGLVRLRTKRLPLHLVRAALWLAAALGFFYGLARMALADTVSIGFSGPLFVTLLAIPMLGERVGFHRWSAVGLGFLGILFMVRPTGGIVDPTALVVLASAVFYATTVILARQLVKTETNTAIIFYASGASVLITGLSLPLVWVTPAPPDFALLALTGVLGAAGQYGVLQALRHADASVVAPLDYTGILWATLFGYIFWHTLPTPWTFTGMALVVASGLYILHRETGSRART